MKNSISGVHTVIVLIKVLLGDWNAYGYKMFALGIPVLREVYVKELYFKCFNYLKLRLFF